MLLGNLIKEKRKELGYSQKELMEGIGSLVMISKIENENKAPAIESLIKVLSKLDLTLNDVFSEYASSEINERNQLFLQCELSFYNSNFKSFQNNMDSIEKLKKNSDQQYELSYLRGIYFLFIQKSNDESIFELNEALQLKNKTDKNLYLQLAIFSFLGKAYSNKNMFRAATIYFNHILEYSDLSIDSLSTIDALRMISALYYTAEFLYSRDNEKANEIARLALTMTNEYHLSHYLDRLILLLSHSSSDDEGINSYYQQIAAILPRLNQLFDFEKNNI